MFDTWGSNFLKTILRASTLRPALTVVDDQWGAPTRAALIADVTAHAVMQLRREASPDALAGVYHLASRGFTTWHGYAQVVAAQAQACGLTLQAGPAQMQPISAQNYPARARRPANSRLDTMRLRNTFSITLPTWQDGVHAVMRELTAFPGRLKPNP